MTPRADKLDFEHIMAVPLRLGEGVHGVDFVLVPEDDDEPVGETERATAEASARLIRALLWQASISTVRECFSDCAAIVNGGDVRELSVIGDLPSAFAASYTLEFAQAFTIVVAEVSQRFTSGWEPLTSTAHELALSILLERAGELGRTYDSGLPDEWVDNLHECLVEDTDYEGLYNSSMGNPVGNASAWFAPFRREFRSAPFVERSW